jgi:ketosteroid isomerase-like protein
MRISGTIAIPAAIPAVLLALFASVVQALKLDAASEERQSDQVAITKILDAQQSNWNQGNVDAFLEGYWPSPDLTFAGRGGIARGWDGVLARYKKNYPDRATMGQLDFSGLEFRFLGADAALVLGQWHLARAQGDVGGVFSLVWQRFPGGWRIIHDHTSTVEKAK